MREPVWIDEGYLLFDAGSTSPFLKWETRTYPAGVQSPNNDALLVVS